MDAVRKVVGVGSVGTRCFVILLRGEDEHDPLFLQVKEAPPSVLEPFAGRGDHANNGKRVVEGQRLLQPAPDIFLGWGNIADGQGRSMDYYVRQLRDMKGGVTIEPGVMRPAGLIQYAGLCGWALALAHARSGDASMISGYLGKGDTFDQAIARFARDLRRPDRGGSRRPAGGHQVRAHPRRVGRRQLTRGDLTGIGRAAAVRREGTGAGRGVRSLHSVVMTDTHDPGPTARMEPLPANEIRRRFLAFFEARGHTIVPSASLVPAGDQTLLFTNSGMVQFKDVLRGVETRSYTRAADAQRCLRVAGKHNDFEEVGRSPSHHTLFEMLGNWSFGDYFKREAIHWAWEFLTVELGIDPTRLAATTYRDDDEAWSIWRDEIGLPRAAHGALG